MDDHRSVMDKCHFCRTERRPSIGGGRRLLTAEQETVLVNMVIASNAIRLREIQTQTVENQVVFQGIDSISISTIDQIVQKNHTRTKQLYRVPFERNSNRVKEQGFQYVQVIAILYRIFTVCRVGPISPAYQFSPV
jgi:hypothetical protein